MSRTKRKSSPQPTPTSKKRKSASPAPTSNTELLNEWHQHLAGLVPDEQALIERETEAARAAGGSRLAVALHLLIVRRILVGGATNPKQKKLWSAYLAANLPGFSISRAQVFKDMKAAEVAKENFPVTFLDEFLTSGYALNVRPTEAEPLGKFTKPCEQILSKLKQVELGGNECRMVLAEATDIIKAQSKKNRAVKTTLTAEKKRESILADTHNVIIASLKDLSRAIEPGDSYTSMHLRDDLELIVSRIMTAVGVDVLELEPMSLPEGYERLSRSGSDVDSSEGETSEAALAATAA